MNRRWFVGASLAAVGSIFVPKFEGWYRQGSGLLVPEEEPGIEDLSTLARDYYHGIYLDSLRHFVTTPFDQLSVVYRPGRLWSTL